MTSPIPGLRGWCKVAGRPRELRDRSPTVATLFPAHRSRAHLRGYQVDRTPAWFPFGRPAMAASVRPAPVYNTAPVALPDRTWMVRRRHIDCTRDGHRRTA